MDKRAGLRREFDGIKADKLADIKSDKKHAEKLARIDSIEETIANAFDSLLNFMNENISKVELTNQLDSIKTPDTEKVVQEVKNLAKTVLSAKTDQKPVVDALNALKREITLLPAKMPQPKDQKDSIKVSNLSEVKLDTSKLEKIVQALNLKVEAPIINIEKPDSYKDELKDILKAVRAIVIPEVKIPEQIPTDTSKIEKKLDESNKHLKVISEKRFGGGGGGGNGSPYTDSNGITKNVILTPDGKIPVDIDMAAEGIATEATLQDAVTKLIYMLDRLEYGQMTDNAKRLKVNLVESGALPLVTAVTTVSTVNAVTTVGTVTNQARIGDIQAQRMVEAMMDVAFSTGITNNLSII